MSVLTHIVVIRIAKGADERQVTRLIEGLRALPSQIPEIASYSVARDMGLHPGNADLAIVSAFASPEDLRAYIDHPAHRAVVTDLLEPVAADRMRIQVPPAQG